MSPVKGRACAHPRCAERVPPGRRLDAEFHSVSCRARYFQERWDAAQTVAAFLDTPTGYGPDGGGRPGMRLAQPSSTMFVALLNAPGKPEWEVKVEQARSRLAEEFALVGEAVIVASVHPRPNPECRHSFARAYALRHDLALPKVDQVAVALLGRPCRRRSCTACPNRGRHQDAAFASTARSAAPSAPPVTNPATHGPRCTKCAEGKAWRRAVREGVVPATNPVARDYITRGYSWHVETPGKPLLRVGLTASGRLSTDYGEAP